MNQYLNYFLTFILFVQINGQSNEVNRNELIQTFNSNDPIDITSGPPPFDKPWVPAWGFFEGYNNSWKERHDALLKQTQTHASSIKVVFLGDSLTDNWNTVGKDVFNKYYTKFGAFNYGIGGDSTREILWRLDHKEMDGLNPKLLILMIGTNNLNDANGWHPWVRGTDEEIAKAIKVIVEKLRIELKNTKILLLGILPQGSEERNKRIKHINTMISEYKDNNYIHYLDMWSHFFDANEKFNSKLFASDTVHPNFEGYQVWAKAMEPMFEKLFNNTKGFQ